ncbi:hypothetical protein HanIR_Chr01g0007571 [Helianthus annuus]|nr:hypothetical protein HanIR_Chr01g0007571 [Helianthus annuus]
MITFGRSYGTLIKNIFIFVSERNIGNDAWIFDIYVRQLNLLEVNISPSFSKTEVNFKNIKIQEKYRSLLSYF